MPPTNGGSGFGRRRVGDTSYAPAHRGVVRLLRNDRERQGFTIGQVAWRLGVRAQEYRELEAGTRSPDFDTWDRICKLYGWPQTFVPAT
jgi:hypothetical protein